MALEPKPSPAHDDDKDIIALYSRIAHHYFTSSAPALAAELRALLRREEARRPNAAVTSVSNLLPRRIRRLLWSWVASAGGGGGGGSSARAKIVERARGCWGLCLSLEEFEALGRKIGGAGGEVGTGTGTGRRQGGLVEMRLVDGGGGGVWEMYRAYYAVLGRLARGEYEESRQGWNVMVMDVRVVLQIIGKATGEGVGGVCGGDGGGRKFLGEKRVVVERVVEVTA